ncbi:MAG: hypothetical protein ACREA0_27545, partial [bacterium]
MLLGTSIRLRLAPFEMGLSVRCSTLELCFRGQQTSTTSSRVDKIFRKAGIVVPKAFPINSVRRFGLFEHPGDLILDGRQCPVRQPRCMRFDLGAIKDHRSELRHPGSGTHPQRLHQDA